MNFNITVSKLHLKTARNFRLALSRVGLLALMLGGFTRPNQAQSVDTILSTNLFEPSSISIDQGGSYYIADSANNRIVKFDITTRNSTAFSGFGGPANFGAIDGARQEARFFDPEGIVALANGFVVADTGNHLIRFVGTNGDVQTIAGDVALAQASIDSGLPPDTYGFRDGVGAAAQFNSPTAVAWDGNDTIYIADTQNDAVRKLRLSDHLVTTVATGFSSPVGVAVGRDGRVYVSDTGNNAIKIIETDGRVTLLAGGNSRFAGGYADNQNGLKALFSAPRGLFFIESNFQLLVADSANSVIRRISDTRQAVRSVDTLVGKSAALLNPVGLTRSDDGSIIIVDRGDNSVKAFRGAGLQLQVSPPLIGSVILTNSSECALINPSGTLFGVMTEVISNSIYNNDLTIAIQPEHSGGIDLGVQTYYTIGPTDPLNPVPDPTSSDASPPKFFDCQIGLPETILSPIRPDTTIKAVSTRVDRRPSPVVTARIRFQVANPRVIGDSATAFNLDSSTTNAVIWYTFGLSEKDVPDPTNASPSIRYTGKPVNIANGTNNIYFKMRAFRDGYAPSSIVKRSFIQTNTVFTTLGAPGDLEAGPGASIIVPVEVTLAPKAQIGSFQYRVDISPFSTGETPTISYVTAVPNDFLLFEDSTVQTPQPAPHPIFTTPQAVQTFQLGVTNGLTVAYNGLGQSFPPLPRILVLNQIETVSYVRIEIPPTAHHGDRYHIAFRDVSATSDGDQQRVDIKSMPERIITVSTNLSYVVGDSALGAGYNAGEFGDRNLRNDDANNAFDADFGLRVPIHSTDAFNAMDAFPVDKPGQVGGDGIIRYLDWQTILHRSFELDPTIWVRRWSDGGILVPSTTNLNTFALNAAEVLPSGSSQPTNIVWKRPALLRAADYPNATQSHLIQVPITMELRPGVKVSGFQFIAKVKAVGEQVPIVSLIFNSSPGFSPPSRVESNGPDEVICAWNYDAFNPPLTGTNVIGNLIFSIPATAVDNMDYAISFGYPDGSLGLDTQIDFESIRGRVSVRSATGPSERLPDEWKAYFFQDVANPLAAADLDPDGDGASNFIEYLDGTNPRASDLSLTRVTATNDVLTFNWFGSARVQYFLEAKSSVNSADWIIVQGPITGTGGILFTSATNTAHLPFQIYRLRANTQPTP